MKTRLVVAIGIIAVFCTGCMIRLLINYPSVNNSELAGIIGKTDIDLSITSFKAKCLGTRADMDRNLNYIQPIKQY
jgi:hypothetical protein